MFEGECLNDKRNGKRSEYYKNANFWKGKKLKVKKGKKVENNLIYLISKLLISI
jgi:hypothetical protein